MNYTLSNVTKDYLDRYYAISGEMIEEMTSIRNTGSISENFIGIYAPVCSAFFKMSENVLRFTQSLPVQRLAEKISVRQSNAKNTLSLINCENSQNSDRDLKLFTRRTNALMCEIFSKMESVPFSNSINHNYLIQMLQLCRGAVDLYNNLLKFSICRGLFDFSNKELCCLRSDIRRIKSLIH